MYNTIHDIQAAGLLKNEDQSVSFSKPTIVFTVLANVIVAALYFGLPRILA